MSAAKPTSPEACERIVFQSDAMVLGEFRCPPSYPGFERAGRITSFVLAFPRRAVWIERSDVQKFVADPGLATIYNPQQDYRRLAISPEGDESDWIGLSESFARDVVRQFCPADADREGAFRFPRAKVSLRAFMAQREIFKIAARRDADRLEVEERAIGMAAAVIGSAYAECGERVPGGPRTRELVEGAKETIMSTLYENLGVSEIAARLGLSVFHLCRNFRATTGMTLHAYRRDMRLRAALGMVPTHRGKLSALALHIGFYSHSHFASSFRQAFGHSPSALVATAMR